MKKSTGIKLFYGVIAAGLIIFAIQAYSIYQDIYHPNVHLQEEREEASLYIPSEANFQQMLDSVSPYLKDTASFTWLADKMNYNTIQPGHYLLQEGMNNKELITKLRGGMQDPVNVTFHNIEDIEELAATVGRQIEADSSAIMQLLTDPSLLNQLGFDRQTVKAMFIPNTYEFYWATSAKQFIRRMEKEYNSFWTSSRIQKAKALNFTKIDVSTLASIVHEETPQKAEEPKIAGVYINRLRKRMRLQADPTVKYLLPDSVERILNKHLKIESPYNTYRNYGLPPGPISIPPKSAIKAVLNYENHNYLYFCAKDDLSGSHVFAKTLKEHLRNARKYQQTLNENNIWR